MINLILISLFGMYGILLLYVTAKWVSMKSYTRNIEPKYGFSIVVPVRNESANIFNLLSSFENLNYDKNLFEVIIADDFSDDNTLEIIKGYIQKSDIKIAVFSATEANNSHKKSAIAEAVNMASFDYIVTTDGDCIVPPRWLHLYNDKINDNPEAVMICAPVSFTNAVDNFLTTSQAIEFSGLMALTAVAIDNKKPLMCNGANLCFSKKAFQKVGGYSGFEHLASGDDEFLMYKLNKVYEGSIFYIKSEDAIVKTKALRSFISLWRQRKRWASKVFSNVNISSKLMACMVYLLHASVIICFGLAIFQYSVTATILLIIKFLVEFLFLRSSGKYFGLKNIFYNVLLLQFCYSFYVIFVGLSLFERTYSWKGRIVK